MSAQVSTGVSVGKGPLAIICGGGTLPFAVAESVRRSGRPVVLFPIKGWVDAGAVASYPHHWLALGQLGRFCRLASREGCPDVVMIGALVRPALHQLRLDWGAIMSLPHVFRMYRGGDDHLLSVLGGLLEQKGFHLYGAHELAPEILVPEGSMGRCNPNGRDRSDIARGLAVLEATGPFDVGQAVVVADNHVLALEAAEGTDNMLDRIAELRRRGRIPTPTGRGVLIKAPKVGQDRRFDLPSIGPQTIAGSIRA
ncbi:MAG TPA: UDP-2,3-diacylglucosamine diphosphatase LpxI, partial [Xanthobacteraceae bacterium]|nr:UDP-2,3-diacylglucosamine diphosphatase LpxI [Xanthobacteraceae bacterium]